MKRLAALLPVVAFAAIGVASAEDEAPDGQAPDDEAQQEWLVHTARMEGAAANIAETARDVAATARAIESDQRLHSMGKLMSDLAELNRRVVSAKLAAEVMDE